MKLSIGFILLLSFLFGCSRLQTSTPKRPSSPLFGHWAEQSKNNRVRHWHFRKDGTFESILIFNSNVSKILSIRTGGYHFGVNTYSLAYIQKYRNQPISKRIGADITFTSPKPVIEKGTFELKDGYLILTNEEDEEKMLYR